LLSDKIEKIRKFDRPPYVIVRCRW